MGTVSLCTVSIYYGLGRHTYYLDSDQIRHAQKWNWIVRPTGIMSIPFAKISISLFILRLLGPADKWQRWFLFVNMVLFSIVSILGCILTFVQCDPPRALWEEVSNATCWDPAIDLDWATFSSTYSAFLDLALAIVPYSFLWAGRKNRSLRRKVSLHLIISAGILYVLFLVFSLNFPSHSPSHLTYFFVFQQVIGVCCSESG